MSMKTWILATAVFALGTVVALGQQTPEPAPSTSPVAPQPQTKSQEEMNALQAIFSAITPEARIQACDKLVEDFPETEFKGFAMYLAAATAQQLDDYERLMVYGERTLEADPNNYGAMLIMASALGQKTREFDLDKEEKLKRAEDYANRAVEILETAPRPRADISDEQWAAAKKDFDAQAHQALGLVAMVRKDYEKAIMEFRVAIGNTSMQDPATHIRLAHVLNQAKKYDQAVAVIDALMADPQLDPQIRQFAEQERAFAVQNKQNSAQQQ